MSDKDLGKYIRENSEEEKEDATKYGEFISSYFAWVSLPDQKRRVERLENITKKKNKWENERKFKRIKKKNKNKGQKRSENRIDLFSKINIIYIKDQRKSKIKI